MSKPLTAQSDEKIFWDEELAFNWDLFKERKKAYSFIKAMTFSGIMYEVDVRDEQVIINTEAYFIYGKSWVMAGYKKPHLLAHEKIHFDIAEIYKRRLDKICNAYRTTYDEFIKNELNLELQRDFDKVFEEMDDFQEKYDLETKHGTDSIMQKKWEKEIKKLLN